MTIEEAESMLGRNLVADLGEARATELAPTIRAAAEALALILREPVGLDDEDPDFCRPPV
jgi:hypothetical protein